MEKPQFLKAVLTEEGIWKRDCLNSFHLRIFKEIRIYEKENRHIHLFSCIQLLLCFYFISNMISANKYHNYQWAHLQNKNTVSLKNTAPLVPGLRYM